MLTEDDIALAGALADAAGAAIRPFFRAACAIETKADASPVTQADRAAEGAMRRLIEAERPRDGIVGEEYGEKTGESGRTWVLDPIDGTRSFIAGRAIFGTLIALLVEDWPVLGVIDQPIAGERWLGAAGRKTLFNGKPARCRPCVSLESALIATTSPHLFADGDVDRYMALVAAAGGGPASQAPLYGGDCYNYGLLALGHIDIVIESGLKLHDYAALVPIVEGAGGRMGDWVGNPLTAASDGRVLAVGDCALIDDILPLISGR